MVGAARGGPNLACAQGGSGFSDSLPDARTRTRRRLAVGAQLARLLASAAGAGCESVRRRVVSGGAGRSVAVQPGPGGRPDGHRGGLRGAVSALFAAGALRRGPNGPVGSAVGAGWRQHRPASPDRRGRHDTRGRSRRRAAVGRSAGRQRLGTIRRLGTVGGTAPRVPREQVVTMNSVAIASGAVSAFLGANFMLLPRWLLGSGDEGASAIVFLVAIPVSIALLWSLRFGPRVLGPDDTERAIHGSAVYAVVTGWLHGARTVVQLPTVAAGLSGLAAHRMVVGINSLLILLLVRHVTARAVGGLGTALLFFAATGLGAFLANVLTPTAIRRWGRYATANGALAAAATIQVAAAGLLVPVMVVCGFLLGVAGQVVKLCADSAMQMDVDDALRGHVFAVQDALFWVSYILSITVAAALIPEHGHAPVFVLFGSAIYLAGLVVHTIVGRRGQPVIGR
ncbi:predicted protein [Mycobacterium tuberculosis T85]|nr:predicted protein [Mycobacterium tuberculosis T85]